ncbi:MAG: hypothetical protein U1E73_05350 [Planctomycetota bacterium]
MIVTPAAPHLAWAKSLESADEPDTRSSPWTTADLIPELDTDEGPTRPCGESSHRSSAGCSWTGPQTTDEREWPKRRTLDMFKKWFTLTMHSTVEEVCEYEIHDDENDESLRHATGSAAREHPATLGFAVMDSFENLVALLLRRDGYWTDTSVKVELTKEQKVAINRPSTPRWEIDVVAYKPSTNELLAVECKSYLDSTGVKFRDGEFDYPGRYKLFTESKTREIVLPALAQQLHTSGACLPNPRVTLCLATGRIATVTDKTNLTASFEQNGWRLFDDEWVRSRLVATADAGYQNDVAMVVAKILLRN